MRSTYNEKQKTTSGLMMQQHIVRSRFPQSMCNSLNSKLPALSSSSSSSSSCLYPHKVYTAENNCLAYHVTHYEKKSLKIYFVFSSETLNTAPFAGSGELIQGHNHAMYHRSPSTARIFSTALLLYIKSPRFRS